MTIKQRQCLLTFLGHDTGGVDGIWGPKSRNATEQAQEDLNIPVDAVWGPQTETAILEAVYTYDVDAPVPEADTSATDDSDGRTDLERLFDGIRYWSPEEFRAAPATGPALSAAISTTSTATVYPTAVI